MRTGQRVRLRRFTQAVGTVVGMTDFGYVTVHWDRCVWTRRHTESVVCVGMSGPSDCTGSSLFSTPETELEAA